MLFASGKNMLQILANLPQLLIGIKIEGNKFHHQGWFNLDYHYLHYLLWIVYFCLGNKVILS
jgi:hypothetical protein